MTRDIDIYPGIRIAHPLSKSHYIELKNVSSYSLLIAHIIIFNNVYDGFYLDKYFHRVMCWLICTPNQEILKRCVRLVKLVLYLIFN